MANQCDPLSLIWGLQAPRGSPCPGENSLSLGQGTPFLWMASPFEQTGGRTCLPRLSPSPNALRTPGGGICGRGSPSVGRGLQWRHHGTKGDKKIGTVKPGRKPKRTLFDQVPGGECLASYNRGGCPNRKGGEFHSPPALLWVTPPRVMLTPCIRALSPKSPFDPLGNTHQARPPPTQKGFTLLLCLCGPWLGALYQ